MTEAAVRRSTSERIKDVLALLADRMDAWVASADPDGTGYLVPLTYFWDGTALIFATPGTSRTIAPGTPNDEPHTEPSTGLGITA